MTFFSTPNQAVNKPRLKGIFKAVQVGFCDKDTPIRFGIDSNLTKSLPYN